MDMSFATQALASEWAAKNRKNLKPEVYDVPSAVEDWVAKLKLACARIDGYVDFDLGAYGSDHADRACLVPIVRTRLRQRFGQAAEDTHIVVVGDTPRDIACARAGGARAIAVATGNFTREQLEPHQPDVLLDDLSDTQTVQQVLLQYSKSRTHVPAPIV